MFYSKSTGGFYTTEIHGKNMPSDVVEITEDQHAALLAAQSQGKQIQADATGAPVAIDPPALTPNEQIISQIAALEATVTPRRMREAALGTDGGWLKSLDGQIATLRAKLTK